MFIEVIYNMIIYFNFCEDWNYKGSFKLKKGFVCCLVIVFFKKD